MLSHHATIFAASSLTAAAETLPVSVGDVDTDVITEATLSIATVRSLIDRSRQRPVQSEIRTFVVVTEQIPVIAQNALLKLFEDPPAHAHFAVVMPRPDELIPTLRSRVMIVTVDNSVPAGEIETTASFLAQPVAAQLSTIESWTKATDVDAINSFLRGVERWLDDQSPKTKQTVLPVLLSVSGRIRQSGASKKMLLEHLVLSLAAR